MLSGTVGAYAYPFKKQIPVSASRTLTTQDLQGVLVVDSTAGPITLALPFANQIRGGGYFNVLALTGATNPVTIIVQGGDTYNNGLVAPLVLTQDAQGVLILGTEAATAWLVESSSASSDVQQYVLENTANFGPFTVGGIAVPFEWDSTSPPLIDDAGDWTALPPVFPAVNPTDIQCNRLGRYKIRFSIAGNTQVADPAAYIAAFADLDGLGLNPSLSQFDVAAGAKAATFIMEWPLPLVASGQILRVLMLAFPAFPILTIDWLAGAGATLAIDRLR